ncbi:SHC-transforming protein 4-like [Girardinichthys multiradiatus]|uniref:SHC-transforming protein 4-like n=1 Tax=Girardinichthys multiradiatus TaxID=208333 RepID=UPI001FABC8B4|nr:SHC-transforming protein 4-like [Girardinichthys multiradiatus]
MQFSSALIMREQTIPIFKSQTRLLPGMLKRTKYSRLRNDSLTSLEDHPERISPSKRDLCLDPDFAQLDPGTPSHHGSSTLRNFIPHVANICLQSPNCLRKGQRGQAKTNIDRTDHKQDDRPLSRTDLGCSLGVSFSSGPNLIHPALLSTKRPITLHRMASLPCTSCLHQSDGLCCLEAVDDCAVVRTSNRAAHHHVKYMGSVEVIQSMRTLDFDTRMQVTREAISRLCERTSVKSLLNSKRSPCKGVSAVLGQINMQFSGNRAILTVYADSLTLITASTLQRIVNHPMQAISFASGGDPDMADYIAYVAKDFNNKRACHIMECPQGRASEVISTIGQAFETRFRQLLSQTSVLLSPRSMVRICPKCSPKETSMDQLTKQKDEVTEQPEYYNVITGKTFFPLDGGQEDKQVTKEEKKWEPDIQEVCLSPPFSLYENYSVREETSAPSADSVQCEDSGERCTPLFKAPVHNLIHQEGWFHGRLGREQAESLLTCSGDFLVRESSSASGQYVLSGMEGATVRHLLLVDPYGQVRTRDQVFQSVGHLVRFHMEKQMPIFSGSGKLCLKQPILLSQ